MTNGKGPGGVRTSPRGRHLADAPSTASIVSDARAAALVDEIGNRAAADQAAFEQAYRLGFESGVEVGRRQLEAELLEQEARFKQHMSSLTALRSHAEQERIRWDGARSHFGDPRPGDYTGGPVQWEDA